MRLISFIIIVCLPAFIIFGSFLLLALNKNVYVFLFEKSSVYANFSHREEVVNLTNNLLGFFNGINPLDSNFFSNQAIVHLSDVRNIINFAKELSFISLVLLAISSGFLAYSKKILLLKKSLSIGAILSLTLTLIVSAPFIINFNFAFEKLHQILFRNDLWFFSSTDSLIKLFPATFFMIFAAIFVSSILILSSLVLILSKLTIKND